MTTKPSDGRFATSRQTALGGRAGEAHLVESGSIVDEPVKGETGFGGRGLDRVSENPQFGNLFLAASPPPDPAQRGVFIGKALDPILVSERRASKAYFVAVHAGVISLLTAPLSVFAKMQPDDFVASCRSTSRAIHSAVSTLSFTSLRRVRACRVQSGVASIRIGSWAAMAFSCSTECATLVSTGRFRSDPIREKQDCWDAHRYHQQGEDPGNPRRRRSNDPVCEKAD
jgi:hypothetical protein